MLHNLSRKLKSYLTIFHISINVDTFTIKFRNSRYKTFDIIPIFLKIREEEEEEKYRTTTVPIPLRNISRVLSLERERELSDTRARNNVHRHCPLTMPLAGFRQSAYFRVIEGRPVVEGCVHDRMPQPSGSMRATWLDSFVRGENERGKKRRKK